MAMHLIMERRAAFGTIADSRSFYRSFAALIHQLVLVSKCKINKIQYRLFAFEAYQNNRM